MGLISRNDARTLKPDVPELDGAYGPDRIWLPAELSKSAKAAYDPTIIISGTITPDHVDEINGDGSGEVIANLCLNGDGLLIFPSALQENANFVGCYMPLNAWISISGMLKVSATHQVLRMEQMPIKLDFSLKKPRASDRIVLFFHFGKATESLQYVGWRSA